MSNKVRCRVWEQSNQCGAARLVLLALAEHANEDGVCWPSISRLAKYSNVSERQTQRILKKLVAEGEVELTVRTGGRGKTQCFIIKGYTDGLSRETTTVAVDTEQKTVTSAASAHASNGAPKGDIQRPNGDIQRPNGDIPVPKADDSSGGKGDKAMSVKDGMAMSPEPKEPLLQPSKEPSVNPLPPNPPPLQRPVEEVVGSGQSTAAHLRTCAGSMLAELGVLPDTARALAGKYEYQFLLAHAAAYHGERTAGGKVGPGALVHRITKGLEPRWLQREEKGPGTFYFDWERPEEIEFED